MSYLMDLAYIRVSTPQPDEEDLKRFPGRRWQQEDSLDKQRELLLAVYAELQLDGELVFEQDDASGGRDDREGLARVIEAIRLNQVRYLFLWDTHRAARRCVTTQRLMWHARNHGTKVYLQSERRFLDWGKPQDRFLVGYKAIMDEQGRLQRSQMIRDAIRFRKTRGDVFGNPAYGYIRQRKFFIVDEPKAEVVRFCFRERLSGKGAAKIARLLTEKTSLGQIPGPWHARIWSGQQVIDILRNGVYSGTDPKYPAIVDQATFQSVRAVLGDRRQPFRPEMKRDNPFEGLLRCGHHKASMMAWKTRGGHDGERELRCAVEFCPNDGALFDPIAKEVIRLLGSEVDRGLADIKVQLGVDGLFARQRKEAAAALDALEPQLKCLIASKKELFLRRSDNLLTQEQMESSLDGLEGRISRLNAQRENLRRGLEATEARIKNKNEGLNWVKNLVARFQSASLDERTLLLRRAIRTISVFERRRIEIEFVKGSVK